MESKPSNKKKRNETQNNFGQAMNTLIVIFKKKVEGERTILGFFLVLVGSPAGDGFLIKLYQSRGNLNPP